MELNNIQTLFSLETEFNADSVEWCPHEPYQNIFVCANYQLIEDSGSSNKRLGKLLLFQLEIGELKLLQTINTSAILDQKWCHIKINNSSLLAVANAERTIELYKFDENNLKLEFTASCNVDSDISETLVLSLDWSSGKDSNGSPEIICSDSKGKVHLIHLDNNNLKKIGSWEGHDYEAWIAGFYYWDTNIFFSGGDDSMFLKFDKRVGTKPISKNKSHEAGVTSFHSNSSKEYLIISGSYDEHIRLWDVRKMKTESQIIKMPGTLWRLKWDPFSHTKILAACMLGGVHIVDSKSDKMELIASYYEHKNIAYGADWSYLTECDKYGRFGQHIVASCSFYDRLLCVSTVNIID